MGAGDFTTATVQLVFFERDGGACFLCGRSLRFEDRGRGWSMHHRKPRGTGGVRGEAAVAIASPANALTLCGSGTTGCHGWAEHNRTKAIEMGVLISRHAVGPAFEPTAVLVMRNDGTKWLLGDSGEARKVGSKSWE
jgi:hypothetical protein